jgi:hypothetical protein
MNKFIVMSAVYEIGRYGHDKIKRQTADAHTGGKLSKFIITSHDLINPKNPPTPDNYRFEAIQAEHADVVIYVDPDNKSIVLKGSEDGKQPETPSHLRNIKNGRTTLTGEILDI